jgi:hypothetical protein
MVGDRPESVTRFCQLYPGRQDIFLCTKRLGLGLGFGLSLGSGSGSGFGLGLGLGLGLRVSHFCYLRVSHFCNCHFITSSS